MKLRNVNLLVFFLLLIDNKIIFAKDLPRILHLSFHKGCINDFKEVAKELLLDVTSWFILSDEHPPYYFDGVSTGNAIYNIGHERAKNIWNKHKDYFDSFDAIITSDTAPLARIFLQNGFNKPLIIWVCNRFDYYDGASLDCDFPDQEYYDLIQQATQQKNVKVISYTPYEYFYALTKGVNFGTFTIKPLGTAALKNSSISWIPAEIKKEETFFIPPRLSEEGKKFLLNKCKELGFKVYCGNYNGPCDLKEFKGIIHFPYAWSNLALFENINYGLIHFVPTIFFVKQLIAENKPIAYFTAQNFECAEWYREENKDLFIYFDSWQDLKNKIETADYEIKNKNIKQFAATHKKTMIARWKEVFEEFNL